MTDPKLVARQLRDIADWAPLLTDTIATLTRPRSAVAAHTGTRRVHRDLGDLLAPAIDAEDQGAASIRTHAHITCWATQWAASAELIYSGKPLHALADNAHLLAETWGDWESFAEDVRTLHQRIARLTGHTPLRLRPCPQRNCTGTITAPTTRNGVSDYAWCDQCEHLYHTDADDYADDLLGIAQNAKLTTKHVTAAEAVRIWQGVITVDHIKKWVQQKRLVPQETHPYRYDLTHINTLAQQLLHKRRLDGANVV